MHDLLKRLFTTAVIIGCILAGWRILAQTLSSGDGAMIDAARSAVSTHEREAFLARARLRAAGRAGLEALFTVHAAEIRTMLNPAAGEAGPSASRERLRGAIDAVARQRDAHASRLFWYTDLSEARNAARAAHRPILSLRLLGNLDEELSCANSRYFRTALYANRAISDRLRAGWILHWESVRPAPHMTIDFGDGRKVERTVTGNSLHYVMDENGEVLDVWPGLVGPSAFLGDLERAETLWDRMTSSTSEERGLVLADFHRARIEEARRGWNQDLASLASAEPQGGAVSRRARAIPASARSTEELSTLMPESAWPRLAALHASVAQLDPNSLALMRLKTRGLYDEESFQVVVAAFQQALAVDHVRNTYLLRPVLDSWFAKGNVPQTAELTERIYDELFLTPRRDPWLGLVPAGVYSGIDGDGRARIGSAGESRRGLDGVPIPSDAEILRAGAPPTAVEAGARTTMKGAVEMPALKQVARK